MVFDLKKKLKLWRSLSAMVLLTWTAIFGTSPAMAQFPFPQVLDVARQAEAIINANARTPLYGYYHNQANKHLYSTDAAEIGVTIPGQTGKYGYTSGGTGNVGYLLTAPVNGAVPVYRYRMAQPGGTSRVLITGLAGVGRTAANYQSDVGNGYIFESIVGYMPLNQQPGTVPLYQYTWTQGPQDNTRFYQTKQDAPSPGIVLDGVLGYIFTSATSSAQPAVQLPPQNNALPPLNGAPGKVVYGHMVNTISAVDWAMGLGVNGVEMDLRFDASGVPSEFRHSTPAIADACDCSAGAAYLATSDNVCKHMGGVQGLLACHASTPAATMLAHLAGSRFANQLAVVYIDSKVDKSDAPPDLAAAGRKVIQFLETNLFGNGYRGQVIISAGDTKYSAYMQAAVTQAASMAHKSQYFFTFDGQSTALNILPSSEVAKREFIQAVQALKDMGTSNRVYGAGIAAIMPGTFYDQISLAAYNKKVGVLSGTGVWTVDKMETMNNYVDFGVDAIMTNVPGDAIKVLQTRKLSLAQPGGALRAATRNDIQANLPPGEICESNSNCGNGSCGRGTAADGALKVCCFSGKFGTFAGFDYCTGMPDGSTCWSDAQCGTGYCRGNGGGTQKGTCGKLGVNQGCDVDANCQNGNCARASADDGAPKVCCSSGRSSRYAAHDYCNGMAGGTRCWSDAMCGSGNCKGNMSGMQRGNCK